MPPIAASGWAMKQGARYYLTKGFDKAALLEALDSVLSNTEVAE